MILTKFRECVRFSLAIDESVGRKEFFRLLKIYLYFPVFSVVFALIKVNFKISL